MDRTNEFFPKSIMLKKEIVDGKEKTVKDYDRLASIFATKVEEGYDMISLEAFELLDVDRDWLLNNFRDEFDYFIVPKGTVKHAIENELLTDFVSAMCAKYRIEEKQAKYALQFKRIFIQRESFYDFVMKYLKITESLSVVTIENEQVNELPTQVLTMLKNEFLKKNQFDTGDKKSKGEKCVKLLDLDDDTFNLILNHKYGYSENRGLKSPATLKDEMLAYYRVRNRLLLVSNEQLSRKLENELGLIKFSIVREGAERHPVRYFLKAPVRYQLDNDNFTFTVSAKYDDRIDEIAKFFTAYVLNYIEEKANKTSKRKK